MSRADYDFAVIVARNEEVATLLDLIQCGEPIRGGEVTAWPIIDPTWGAADRGILISAPGVGIDAAKAAAEIAVNDYDVSLIANVGLAGGIAQDLRIGDVVVSQEIVDLTSESQISSGFGTSSFAPAPAITKLSSPLVRLAATFLEADTRRLEPIRESVRARMKLSNLWSRNGFRVLVRPTACVSSAVANEGDFQSIRAQHRDVAAVDMDSAGIMSVVQGTRIEFINVRGISDRADPAKQDFAGEDRLEAQRFALDAATSVLGGLFMLRLEQASADPQPQHEIEPESAPGEDGKVATVLGGDEAPPPDIDFFDDDAELDSDALGRGGLALVMARRLHMIWTKLNRNDTSGRGDSRAAFVLHLDAPWGGGKTSFANFVARILNPYGYGPKAAKFLRERFGEDRNLATLFAADPEGTVDTDVRPWIIVDYNAWCNEHVSPPWWVFYQAIRRGCFGAILREGDRVAEVNDQGNRRRRPRVLPTFRWLWLWVCEIWWRLLTPKLIIPLIGTLIVAVVNLGLHYSHVIELEPKSKEQILSTGNWLLLASGALTALGAGASILIESLSAGIDPLAERLGLGNSDPLARFRRHFQRTLLRVRRPVLVVVDDLDRCKPDVIVDLVRGMQTILRSPRVVFLLLGDRDWLERAFEAKHGDMADVAGSAEQSIGARFVEKTIQLSYVLPGIDERTQANYVGGLLGGAMKGLRNTPGELALRENLRAKALANPKIAFNPSAVRKQASSEWSSRLIAEANKSRSSDGSDTSQLLDAHAADRVVAQIVNEELAISVAATPTVEQETARRLIGLAPWLPANPRQIKRILNGFAIHHAAALQHPHVSTAGDRWFQLAIWVVLMIEWPTTWRILAAFPEMADILASDDPVAAIDTLDAADLPGSREATAREIMRMRQDKNLMSLIASIGRSEGPRLGSEAIRELLKLTPPYNRSARLLDPAEGNQWRTVGSAE